MGKAMTDAAEALRIKWKSLGVPRHLIDRHVNDLKRSTLRKRVRQEHKPPEPKQRDPDYDYGKPDNAELSDAEVRRKKPEILNLLAIGFGVQEIATRLGVPYRFTQQIADARRQEQIKELCHELAYGPRRR